MAHFAEVIDGIVTRVIVVSNDDCGDTYPASEAVGQSFIADIKIPGHWYQTSYNSNFRNKLAGIGDSFENDMFIAPQPYASWTLVDGSWEAPVEMPDDDERYSWDEDTLAWI